MSLLSKINGKDGFSLDISLDSGSLAIIHSAITRQWLSVIAASSPDKANAFSEVGIESYHELSHLVDHASLWSKKNRILPADVVSQIKQMPFFKQLIKEFGEFDISDEEEIGYEEIYWRLVRPNEPSDIGPLHADKWFWDLGHGVTPNNVKRIKVWISIASEPGKNGLKLVPSSHLVSWKFGGEQRSGFVKPTFDESQVDMPINLINTKPGDAIVFNDELLHGGSINKGVYTRVSLEFTMFVKETECVA